MFIRIPRGRNSVDLPLPEMTVAAKITPDKKSQVQKSLDVVTAAMLELAKNLPPQPIEPTAPTVRSVTSTSRPEHDEFEREQATSNYEAEKEVYNQDLNVYQTNKKLFDENPAVINWRQKSQEKAVLEMQLIDLPKNYRELLRFEPNDFTEDGLLTSVAQKALTDNGFDAVKYANFFEKAREVRSEINHLLQVPGITSNEKKALESCQRELDFSRRYNTSSNLTDAVNRVEKTIAEQPKNSISERIMSSLRNFASILHAALPFTKATLKETVKLVNTGMQSEMKKFEAALRQMKPPPDTVKADDKENAPPTPGH